MKTRYTFAQLAQKLHVLDAIDLGINLLDNEQCRTFACACVRMNQEIVSDDRLKDEGLVDVIRVANAYARGKSSERELTAARKKAKRLFWEIKERHSSFRRIDDLNIVDMPYWTTVSDMVPASKRIVYRSSENLWSRQLELLIQMIL